MMLIYSNIADSVHFTEAASYIPTEWIFKEEHMKKFKNFLEEIRDSNEQIKIGFTLNQIADNSVFFIPKGENGFQLSKEIFELLIKLLTDKKAFISTYNKHTVITYAKQSMISSWKRICDDKEDDIQYISSLIEALAKIQGQSTEKEGIIHYSDRNKRDAHKAMFGVDKLCKISNDTVFWDNGSKPIKKYLQEYCKKSKDYGFYNGLEEKEKNPSFSIRDKKVLVFVERILKIHEVATYKENATFVHENKLSISSVINALLLDDKLIKRIYDSTIDNALHKRLKRKNKISEFVSASKDSFLYIIENIKGKPTRSKIYLQIHTAIDEYLRPIMDYSEKHYQSNRLYKYAASFFSEFIDFAYNYFNCLQVFGMSTFNFSFYPYNTEKGRYDSITEPIILKNIYDQIITYKIIDEKENIIEWYLNIKNAKETKEQLLQSHKHGKITDRNGDVIDEF